MRFWTHIALSLLIFIFIIKRFEFENKFIFLAVMLFFTALPDIDYSKSKIGAKTRPFSYILNFIFGHRGMFHSLAIPIVIFLMIYIFSVEIAFASLIGYLSHLLADSLTPQGIMPFYPFSKSRIKGFIKTGSLLEWAFLICVLILIFVSI